MHLSLTICLAFLTLASTQHLSYVHARLSHADGESTAVRQIDGNFANDCLEPQDIFNSPSGAWSSSADLLADDFSSLEHNLEVFRPCVCHWL